MLLAFLTSLCLSAHAQITITNATFPAVGDTFRVAFDLDPVGIQAATPPGVNQLWDFSGLQAAQTDIVVYQAASAGMNAQSFPGSDLTVIGESGETHYNVTDNQFQLLGYAGSDPAALGLQVTAKFNPVVVERRAPLNFFDVSQQTSNLTLPFSAEELPDELFEGAPFTPDSIRVRINTQRLEVVDAWGNCQIPGGTYPVLRQKRTDYNSTAIDVKVPFLGWLDISQFGGGGFGDFLGTDTTVTYRFLSGTEKQEIAVVTMENDLSTPASVRFKNNETVSTEGPDGEAPGSPSVSAFPNPAVERVRFDCVNLPPADYTLKVFNIIGKVVWKNQFTLTAPGSRAVTVELADFKKGTYLYSLVDGKGNTIGTRRLVVLKP
jgi:hypothetical protein